jgi:maltooligosyltrehalose trehalohydrolase
VTATYNVWAPEAGAVEVLVGGKQYTLTTAEGGWWETTVPEAEADDDYAFSVDGSEPLPDPRSPWQPHGVDGPSRGVDHGAFAWSDQLWHGRPLGGAVIYELHVGTFTVDGTFDGVVERLDHLVELGVDFVELMPVNAFSGAHGWGYDGVGLYAVHDNYGGPEALKRFVDACHARGLGVILDVVYNHLGAAGNYLPRFGPYFTDDHQTPWGAAVNLDDAHAEHVRRFFIDNAVQWLRDYHCDGLRLDAVHAMADASAIHFLADLRTEVDELSANLGRTLVLIAESDSNDPRMVTSRDVGGYGMDAQWSDDFHHALHAALTGERDGYYVDFGPLADVATALQQGFVLSGQASRYRGRPHGAPLPHTVNGHRLIGYLQTHDQVGNRAQGERMSALVSRGLLQVGAALVLTSPFTPMLFMGEEWGAGTPWQYFTAHEHPELAKAVREGRRGEFAAFGWEPEQVPDPQDPATYDASLLDWAELDKEPHTTILNWHVALIGLRRSWPDLTDGRLPRVGVAYDEDARWLVVHRGRIAVACNLAPETQTLPLPGAAAGVLLASEPGFVFAGETVTIAGESVAILTVVPT